MDENRRDLPSRAAKSSAIENIKGKVRRQQKSPPRRKAGRPMKSLAQRNAGRPMTETQILNKQQLKMEKLEYLEALYRDKRDNDKVHGPFLQYSERCEIAAKYRDTPTNIRIWFNCRRKKDTKRGRYNFDEFEQCGVGPGVIRKRLLEETELTAAEKIMKKYYDEKMKTKTGPYFKKEETKKMMKESGKCRIEIQEAMHVWRLRDRERYPKKFKKFEEVKKRAQRNNKEEPEDQNINEELEEQEDEEEEEEEVPEEMEVSENEDEQEEGPEPSEEVVADQNRLEDSEYPSEAPRIQNDRDSESKDTHEAPHRRNQNPTPTPYLQMAIQTADDDEEAEHHQNPSEQPERHQDSELADQAPGPSMVNGSPLEADVPIRRQDSESQVSSSTTSIRLERQDSELPEHFSSCPFLNQSSKSPWIQYIDDFDRRLDSDWNNSEVPSSSISFNQEPIFENASESSALDDAVMKVENADESEEYVGTGPLAALHNFYNKSNYPNEKHLQLLAEQTGLDVEECRLWLLLRKTLDVLNPPFHQKTALFLEKWFWRKKMILKVVEKSQEDDANFRKVLGEEVAKEVDKWLARRNDEDVLYQTETFRGPKDFIFRTTNKKIVALQEHMKINFFKKDQLFLDATDVEEVRKIFGWTPEETNRWFQNLKFREERNSEFQKKYGIAYEESDEIQKANFHRDFLAAKQNRACAKCSPLRKTLNGIGQRGYRDKTQLREEFMKRTMTTPISGYHINRYFEDLTWYIEFQL